MTPTHNTSISGIVEMVSDGNKPKELHIYHNHYAKIPFAPSLLQNEIVKHFILEKKLEGNFQDWIEVSQ